MDSSIGQAAFDQAKAFQDAVDVGAVIITKLDGHAKGGGALSAVAATQSPIIFLGTGEHMDDLEEFDTRRFVGKLLGMGDIEALIQNIREVVPKDEEMNKELVNRLQRGEFSLRDMYDQFENIMKMGPLNKVMENLPGMSNLLKQGNLKGLDSNQKVKVYMTVMDSMTDAELDDPRVLDNKKTRDTRIIRIARGAGRSIREVNELLDQFKHFQKMMAGLGKMKIGKGGQMNPRQMQGMANMLPANVMRQFGGMSGIQNLMKQLGK
jgi:signal recognition particle subunit SRP54